MSDVTTIFKRRLKELRGDTKQQEVANAIGISRATLGYYENGDRKPDIEVLARIAEYFHVSCDYLLGFTDVKTPNEEVQNISNLTGLNEHSASFLADNYKLSIQKTDDPFEAEPTIAQLLIKTLDALLSEQTDLLSHIIYYLYCNFDYFYDDYCFKDESLYRHITELGLFDKKLGIGIGYYENNFVEIFLLKIEKELSQLREHCQSNLPERNIPVAVDDDIETELDEELEMLKKKIAEM